jgi:hypothetical protein
VLYNDEDKGHGGDTSDNELRVVMGGGSSSPVCVEEDEKDATAVVTRQRSVKVTHHVMQCVGTCRWSTNDCV